MTTPENVTLNDCEIEDGIGPYGIGTRWTHESGAYVELIHDDDAMHPLDDMEGITIAFREGDRYNGTADPYPRYPEIECSHCSGSGENNNRYTLRRGYFSRKTIGTGSEGAMLALQDLAIRQGDSGLTIFQSLCAACEGVGYIEIDIETYFRVKRGARAIYEFNTGNYGEATAVMYVTGDDWNDPAAAAKAWAEEYQAWAEGDVWGIEAGGPGIETESVWGFIGRDNAEGIALSEFLIPTINATRAETIERDYWLARGIETI